MLSNRYITDRFLPDKAIDLVDEAAARLRTEIDSMPTELDERMRRIMQLEIEREALKKENDAASRERLGKIEKELADLQAEADALQARWQTEKKAVAHLRSLREQIEQTKLEIEQAERAVRPEPRGRAEVRQAGRSSNASSKPRKRDLSSKEGAPRLLKEEVDEEDIAEVVSRWTGVPVSKLLEGELEKLLHLEEELHKRVVGQDEAVTRGRGGAARALGSEGPATGPSAASSSWGRPASARPNWRGRWPSSCSTTSAP